MGTSYPNRTNARGIWKLSDITKNKITDGTYPGSSPAPSGRALIGGGFAPGYVATTDFVQIGTAGDATDFGDLSIAKGESGCISSFIRAIWCGGNTAVSPNATNIIDYVHFATLGNAADFGDIGGASIRATGVAGNNTRGVVTEGSSDSDQLQFISPQTLGNATDFGNLSVARVYVAGMTSNTRGLFAGGFSPTLRDTVDFIEIASTGNAVDFGNLTAANRKGMSCSSHIRGVYGGGISPSLNVIQYLTMSSLGNMSDFGDLSGNRTEPASTSDSVRGVWAGGQVPSNTNIIEQVEISTTGDATDFGDLTAARYSAAANSNAHGGLNTFHPRAPELYSITGKPFPDGGGGVGDLGIFAGGEYNYSNIVEFITISSVGNGVDYGDLDGTRSALSGAGGKTRGFTGGGQPGLSNVITYKDFRSKGNFSDFGDLTGVRDKLASLNTDTRAVWGGGRTETSSNTNSNVMDYITMASIGNASDFGDLSVSRKGIQGGSSTTRGVFSGGYTPSFSDVMDYITIANTGNATDFGNLTVARAPIGGTGAASSTRMLTAGGQKSSNSNVVDYITIANTGNATDFGDLEIVTPYSTGVSNSTRAVFTGFNNTGAPGADSTFGNCPQINYFTIASTGNYTTFGELTSRRYGLAGISNGHGGLS